MVKIPPPAAKISISAVERGRVRRGHWSVSSSKWMEQEGEASSQRRGITREARGESLKGMNEVEVILRGPKRFSWKYRSREMPVASWMSRPSHLWGEEGQPSFSPRVPETTYSAPLPYSYVFPAGLTGGVLTKFSYAGGSVGGLRSGPKLNAPSCSCSQSLFRPLTTPSSQLREVQARYRIHRSGS